MAYRARDADSSFTTENGSSHSNPTRLFLVPCSTVAINRAPYLPHSAEQHCTILMIHDRVNAIDTLRWRIMMILLGQGTVMSLIRQPSIRQFTITSTRDRVIVWSRSIAQQDADTDTDDPSTRAVTTVGCGMIPRSAQRLSIVGCRTLHDDLSSMWER
mmetsp:Transcript_3561/g.9446  ORF Transcript_3561/g.9446 Transcript_3561/m.9446 type:complete len:158 (-) Transcript_3561:788-1261(-)